MLFFLSDIFVFLTCNEVSLTHYSLDRRSLFLFRTILKVEFVVIIASAKNKNKYEIYWLSTLPNVTNDSISYRVLSSVYFFSLKKIELFLMTNYDMSLRFFYRRHFIEIFLIVIVFVNNWIKIYL
jgi:hypothetical protein